MSTTPLTIATATAAGQVAAAIQNIESLIADLQAGLASSAPITQITVALQGNPVPLTANFILSASDTAAIFDAFLTILQNNRAALNAQLAMF